jgi:hypothetical protein
MISLSVSSRLLASSLSMVLALAATSCDDGDAPTEVGNAGGGCSEAGPLTRDLLPTFASEETTTIENPCLEFVGLLSQVTGLIPDNDRTMVGGFLGAVGDLTDRVAKVADLVECGYQTDRLAIVLYQNKATRWSIGIVAIVRGDVAAAVSTSICFLRKQVPLTGPTDAYLSGPEGPQPGLCFDVVRRTRGGESYTVMWLGSSDFMCWDLNNQLNSGRSTSGGITATVKAVPDVAVRSGPSTKAAMVGRVPTGAVGVVSCYVRGETVTGRRGTSARWDLTTINGLTGFIADVWLDTAGDVATRVKRCASP